MITSPTALDRPYTSGDTLAIRYTLNSSCTADFITAHLCIVNVESGSVGSCYDFSALISSEHANDGTIYAQIGTTIAEGKGFYLVRIADTDDSNLFADSGTIQLVGVEASVVPTHPQGNATNAVSADCDALPFVGLLAICTAAAIGVGLLVYGFTVLINIVVVKTNIVKISKAGDLFRYAVLPSLHDLVVQLIGAVELLSAIVTTVNYANFVAPSVDSMLAVWQAQADAASTMQPCAVWPGIVVSGTCGDDSICTSFARSTSVAFTAAGDVDGACGCIDCDGAISTVRALHLFKTFALVDVILNWIEVAVISIFVVIAVIRESSAVLLAYTFPRLTHPHSTHAQESLRCAGEAKLRNCATSRGSVRSFRSRSSSCFKPLILLPRSSCCTTQAF